MEFVMSAPGVCDTDLERRLVSFSVLVTGLLEALPDHRVASHIADQLLRSGRLPAEAQGPERETVRTMKSLLGELQETGVWLRIIHSKSLMEASAMLEGAMEECHQLTAIMVSCIAAARPPAEENLAHAYALSSGH
jgi:four helix bundle protein